ncbi:MAG TPA: DEAD/DEAH box helicase, partial [Ruminiclostridium sp.]|nr:DEAD/DEAH box helicase [Ruminiclostridium sp.]
PHAFDEFFEIYKGKQLAVNVYSDYSSVLLQDGDPELKISVKPDKGSFKVKMELPDLLISGQEYQYIFSDGKLFRCSKECTKATETILQAMMKSNGMMTISDKDMGGFCSNVLTEIRTFVKIDADENSLSRFYPRQLTSKLYLDMISQGFITGNLNFCYGETEIDAMSEETFSFQRSVKDELIAQSLIKKYFEAYDPDNKFLFIRDDDGIYKLLSEGIDEMSQVIEIYTTTKFKTLKMQRPPQISIGVRLRSNLIDMDFDTGDFPLDELASLLHSYRQKKKYHKLRDGTFVGLEDNSLSDISQLAQGLDLKDEDLGSGTASVAKFRALYLDGIIKDSGQLKGERDSGFKAMVRDINDIGDSEIEPPSSLRNILRKYQKTGFRWLKTMSRYGFGGVLADDMGLGKTLQTIAFLLSAKEENQEHTISLIVCPASLVLNWESEIEHFAPQLKALSIIGDAQQRINLISQIPEYDAIITSYDLLKRDIELYEKIDFYCQIIDEAQYIKNAATQNAKAVKTVQSQQRFALTGTPIENSLAEIWSIFDFLMPGYLRSHNRFKQDFELPIMKNDDSGALSNLKKMLSPFILRRLKSNVLKELPPKTETVLYAGLDGEQKRLYVANLAKIRSQLSSQMSSGEMKTGKVIVLAMLTRLRQLCCDPSLCYDDYRGESSKLDLCIQLLESSVLAGHKVLLFSQFTSMLSIIEDKLKKLSISYYVLKGSTPKEDRAALTQRFNNDNTNVFLISLKAGGTGLNLTGADIVIHYDPWWNVSAQNQATDRAHRIGQMNSVQVYKLIAKDTIEEKILKLQQDKSKLADSVISEGDGMISKMSPDEILALFDE